MLQPESIPESEIHKILWDFQGSRNTQKEQETKNNKTTKLFPISKDFEFIAWFP